MNKTREMPPIEEQSTENNQVDTDIEEQNQRPIRIRKKRRKKNYFLRLFVVLLLMAGSIYVMSLNYFDIDTITFKGNTTITNEQALKESGVKNGDNLFALNKRRVIKKMKKNPYYKNIKINKNLPNQVVFTIEERVPSVVLPYGDKFVILDEEGVVLGLEKENPKLTQITGMTIEKMDKGEKLEAKESEDFLGALSIVKKARKEDLFFKSISIDKENALCNVYDGLSVKGKIEEVIANMENGNLQDILYDLHSKQIKRGTVKIVEGRYCSFTPTVE